MKKTEFTLKLRKALQDILTEGVTITIDPNISPGINISIALAYVELVRASFISSLEWTQLAKEVFPLLWPCFTPDLQELLTPFKFELLNLRWDTSEYFYLLDMWTLREPSERQVPYLSGSTQARICHLVKSSEIYSVSIMKARIILNTLKGRMPITNEIDFRILVSKILRCDSYLDVALHLMGSNSIQSLIVDSLSENLLRQLLAELKQNHSDQVDAAISKSAYGKQIFLHIPLQVVIDAVLNILRTGFVLVV